MEKFKGTKGDWSAKDKLVYRRDWRDLYEYGGKLGGDKPIASLMGTGFYEKEEIEANAKLIADAGTTASKCGMMPSELLEQRNDLLEALQETVLRLEYALMRGDIEVNTQESWRSIEIAKEAIEKALK